MIMWKKYYSREIKKKYVVDSSLFNQDHQVLNNKKLLMSICDYLKMDLKNNYFKSFFDNILKMNKILKGFKVSEDSCLKYNYIDIKNDIVQKYLNSFFNIIFVLKNIKTTFYQSCFNILSKHFFQKQDFLVFYTIYFNFSKSNTNLQIIDSSGKSKNFYSAGLVDLKGKQKVLRRLVIVKLFNLLTLLKYKFIKKTPIALHFKNVGSNKFLILKKLKRKFFIKIIKTFELNAYNGCRKKKERRKRNKKRKN